MEKIEYNNKLAEIEDEESKMMDDLSEEQHDLLCFQSEANQSRSNQSNASNRVDDVKLKQTDAAKTRHFEIDSLTNK